MKTVKMKIGSGTVNVSVPEKNLIGVIEKPAPFVDKSEQQVILDALANPIGRPRLGDMVKPGESVAIIVSDISRAWQRMFVYLPYIVKELNDAGVKDKDIRFISATGYHRMQTADEHAKLLGEELAARFTMVDHDCKDSDNMIHLGTTDRGTPVAINKAALDADHMVLTGAVCYHPWVGWGGGKKSILPGIAAFETIQRNHVMTMSDEIGGGQRLEVRNGNIKGNPVHWDMLEAADMVNPAFMFNSIIGPSGKITHAVAGHYIEAHEVGCRIVDDLYGIPINELADIVISSQGGFPKDIEFYQTGKAVYIATDALKPGGYMIILSECAEGLGPPDALTIFQECENTLEREREVRELFTVPKYVSYYISEAADKYKMIIVGSIDPKLLAKTPIRVVDTVDEALAIAFKEKGEDQTIYLMPQGSSALPKLQNKQERQVAHE